MKTEQKWNFKVVFNRSCCHGNYENVKFYLSIKIFHQCIFHLPSFSLWAASFLLPSFGKWHVLTNCQNCVQTQGQGLRFPCYDQTERVHRRPESAINLNQQLVSRQLKKVTSFQWVVQLGLWYTQVTLVSGHPFWELSIDRNIDVHKG